MQPAKLKEMRMMSIDRVPQFLQRALERGYTLLEGGLDILSDGEVERMKIYIRVYLFDYLDGNLALRSQASESRVLLSRPRPNKRLPAVPDPRQSSDRVERQVLRRLHH